MAASSPLPPTFKIEAFSRGYMLNYTLYLHQIIGEPSPTQKTILIPNGKFGFGEIVANNWAIVDGPDPFTAAIVARAHGLHILSGNWHNSFTIAFESDRFKGSTLEVMGLDVDQGDHQWGIVSGTGEFAMARGYINRKLHDIWDNVKVIELDIHATLEFTQSFRLIRHGPKGGSEGKHYDFTYEPRRLVSIAVRHGEVVDAVVFSYTDKYGIQQTEEQWGGNGGRLTNVKLDPTEFVQQITGNIFRSGDPGHSEYVASLRFVTNIRSIGPFGTQGGKPFSLPEKKGGTIVGFFGRAQSMVHALGVLELRDV